MYDDYEDDYQYLTLVTHACIIYPHVEPDVTDEEYAELMSDIILERQELEDFEGNDWYDSHGELSSIYCKHLFTFQ